MYHAFYSFSNIYTSTSASIFTTTFYEQFYELRGRDGSVVDGVRLVVGLLHDLEGVRRSAC